MEKDHKIYLKLILDSIGKIESFNRGLNYQKFTRDNKTQSASIMQLHIIGELSKKINKETREKIAIPWRDIAGMRDIISHDYFDMDLKIIWKTINKDLEKIKEELVSYLRDY